jgi:hypothetical protein
MPMCLDVTLYAAPGSDPWDATNYLGGVADVLEVKDRRGPLAHLGALLDVAVYANDRQIRQIHYRQVDSSSTHYRVRVWSLDP